MKRFSIKEKKERKSTDLIFSVILFLYSSQADIGKYGEVHTLLNTKLSRMSYTINKKKNRNIIR